MHDQRFRLRQLTPATRLGLTGLLVVMLGGMVSSFLHLVEHHENRDERPGLTMDDVRGAYHGIRTTAPMLMALEQNHPAEMDMDGAAALGPDDRRVLLDWLAGDRISSDYDNLDLGDAAPVEIIAASCLHCHSRQATQGDGVGERLPLDYWNDVKTLAFSRDISPTSIEILNVSTHTHALSLATLSLVICLMLVGTRWPRAIVGAAALLIGLGLLSDLAAQWITRSFETFAWVIVIGGTIFGVATSLAAVAIVLDLWLPAGRPIPDAG